MVVKIQYTDDAKSFQGVKCCVYGRSGTGKTRLAATGPRPFIFSAENGLLSLRKVKVPYSIIKTYKDLEEARDWALKSAEARNYDTLSLDSVSEIAEVLLADEKEKTKDPRKAYGELSGKVQDVLRDFRDMPQKHVLFIAKEEAYDVNGMKTSRPSFPGQQLGQAMPYFFDEVFHLIQYQDQQTKEFAAALKCRTDQLSEAKDRSGALEPWEPANLTHIFNKIMAG